MRKHFISMLFATALSAFLLSGCGDTTPAQDSAVENELGVYPSPEIEESTPTPTEPVAETDPPVESVTVTPEPTEAPMPTAEPVTASYGRDMLYVSQFELVDGVLTVTFISDDGEPVETISYPVSDTCSWECDGLDGMGTVFLYTTTYEELKADVDSWYNIYVSGEYYESPGLLGIEVEDSVIVKVYSLYS